MTANREVLHQTGWGGIRVWQEVGKGEIGRRCSRAFEKVGLDSEPVGEIFGERGRRKHRVDATNDKSTNGRGDQFTGPKTSRKFQGWRRLWFYPCAWPEICISTGGEPRDVSLRTMLFTPFAHRGYSFLPIAPFSRLSPVPPHPLTPSPHPTCLSWPLAPRRNPAHFFFVQ